MGDWTQEPAPGEHTIPPAPVIERVDPSAAGCWVNDHHGIYAPVIMVDHAVSYGWPLSDEDAEVLEWARNGGIVATEWSRDKGVISEDDDLMHMPACWDEIQTEAEQWLNDHVAPEDYSFGWFDGAFYLGHTRWWNQDDEDLVGFSRDKNGDPIAVDIDGSDILPAWRGDDARD
jgi:hypothetical protein